MDRLAHHVILLDSLMNESLPWDDWMAIVEQMIIQWLLVLMLTLQLAALTLQHVLVRSDFFSVVNAGGLAR